jgi:hypothetical protein
MITIQQEIRFNSDNRYFAGFLQDIVQRTQTCGSVMQKEGVITLTLEDDDEKLEKLGKEIERYLPSSLFLGEIKTLQNGTYSKEPPFTSPGYNIALCPCCLEALTDPASFDYLNDALECMHYGNDEPGALKDHQNYSPHYTEGAALLLVDPKKTHELFLITDGELQALFSIEKPLIKVTIKDEELKALTKKSYIYIQSPRSTKANLVALNAAESDMPYLFFHPQNELFASVVKKHTLLIRDARGIAKGLLPLSGDKVLNRFLNITRDAGFYKNALGVCMSSQNGVAFVLSGAKEDRAVLSFIPFVFSEVWLCMESDEVRSRLLVNFAKKHPQIYKELKEGDFNLFETLCVVLGLNEHSFEALSDKSLEFHGNGGLKFDMFFNENGFDYMAFLASVMSFRIAEENTAYLAYSIFEAFADMAMNTLSQLKQKFLTEHFVLFGDMFANSVLLSRILSKFQTQNPYFSKQFALDDAL